MGGSVVGECWEMTGAGDESMAGFTVNGCELDPASVMAEASEYSKEEGGMLPGLIGEASRASICADGSKERCSWGRDGGSPAKKISAEYHLFKKDELTKVEPFGFQTRCGPNAVPGQIFCKFVEKVEWITNS